MPLPKDPIKAEETRRKMSEAAKGRKQSPETIAKRVAAITGQQRSLRTKKNCAFCGKEMILLDSSKNRKFCSRVCKGKWMSKNRVGEKGAHWQGGGVTKKCEECGKEFNVGKTRIETATFCSFTCKGVWMSKNRVGEKGAHWHGGGVTKKCEECGKEFSVGKIRNDNARFCSFICKGVWQSKNLIGINNPNWTGGPKDYCEKWNLEFRRRIRAFFDFQCAECGTPQNEKQLHCHHVYYDKKACCSVNENGKYVSNLGIAGNPYSFEIIGDPNKFVALCDNCHKKTSGKKNREFWARHFEEIINQYYLGRSYFTKEEYEKIR